MEREKKGGTAAQPFLIAQTADLKCETDVSPLNDACITSRVYLKKLWIWDLGFLEAFHHYSL